MIIKKTYNYKHKKKLYTPIYPTPILASFPSPADDYIDLSLDLNQLLIKNNPATFFAYAKGDSMVSNGIRNGDLLIIDRSIKAKNNNIVIASLHGELIVKKLGLINGKKYLIPGNDKYKPINIESIPDFEIWGIVTYSIHSLS